MGLMPILICRRQRSHAALVAQDIANKGAVVKVIVVGSSCSTVTNRSAASPPSGQRPIPRSVPSVVELRHVSSVLLSVKYIIQEIVERSQHLNVVTYQQLISH